MSDQNTTYTPHDELADLGGERFDRDVAAAGDRDYALAGPLGPGAVMAGRAPRGMESKIFAWNAFRYTTEDTNEREELKGDLHEGQLHRLNRAAVGINLQQQQQGMTEKGGYKGKGKSAWGRVGNVGKDERTSEEGLCAGRMPEDGVCPPLAKGVSEGVPKEFFFGAEGVIEGSDDGNGSG